MTIEQVQAAVGAQQDQEMQDAKKWLRGNGPEGSVNAQAIPLWRFCASDQPTELEDVATRFAMIGIRHVLQQL